MLHQSCFKLFLLAEKHETQIVIMITIKRLHKLAIIGQGIHLLLCKYSMNIFTCVFDTLIPLSPRHYFSYRAVHCLMTFVFKDIFQYDIFTFTEITDFCLLCEALVQINVHMVTLCSYHRMYAYGHVFRLSWNWTQSNFGPSANQKPRNKTI